MRLSVKTQYGSAKAITNHKGFTLLEVVLVLGLIGLILASVSYSFLGENKEKQIRKEVQRLQVLFNMASDFAVINQLELGLRLDLEKQTYEFVTIDPDQQWVSLAHIDEQLKHFELTELPQGVYLDLILDGFAWQQDDSLFDARLFDENLSVSNDRVNIGEDDEQRPPPPQIFILSSGEITPFELLIAYQAQEIDETNFEYVLEGRETVPITLIEPQ